MTWNHLGSLLFTKKFCVMVAIVKMRTIKEGMQLIVPPFDRLVLLGVGQPAISGGHA